MGGSRQEMGYYFYSYTTYSMQAISLTVLKYTMSSNMKTILEFRLSDLYWTVHLLVVSLNKCAVHITSVVADGTSTSISSWNITVYIQCLAQSAEGKQWKTSCLKIQKEKEGCNSKRRIFWTDVHMNLLHCLKDLSLHLW
jgi:hypothetical protein